MLWYGTVWYGMVRYGIVWFGMVWYGLARHGTAWRLAWRGIAEQSRPYNRQYIVEVRGLTLPPLCCTLAPYPSNICTTCGLQCFTAMCSAVYWSCVHKDMEQ